MRLQVLTFIFLALCLGLLALYVLHVQAAGESNSPTPATDSTPSQYKL